jgi:hypothetical protein
VLEAPRWPIIAALPASVQLVSTKWALFPTDMAEVVRIIPVVMWQTTRFAEGLTLCLRSTTAGLFLGLGESPLVSLARISLVLWNLCRILRCSTRQRIEVRGNAHQHTQHTGMIEPDKLGVLIRVGTQIHHDLLSLVELFQPGQAPSQHLNFARNVCPY